MAVLCPVVEMSTDLLAVIHSDLFHGSTIGPKPISNDSLRRPISLHRFLQKCKCGLLIPGLGDIGFENLAFMIDCAPEIVVYAVDLYKHLIKVSPPLWNLAHEGSAPLSNLPREDRTKPVDPKSNALVTNVDPALMQKVFNAPQ